MIKKNKINTPTTTTTNNNNTKEKGKKSERPPHPPNTTLNDSVNHGNTTHQHHRTRISNKPFDR